MIPSINIDLSLPPSSRWSLTPEQIRWAQSLVQTTLSEIGGVEPYREQIELHAAEHIAEPFAAEMKSLSMQCGQPYIDVLTANLYYDFVKLLLGCTAFAVNTPNGPIHARNMDWFSENNCLSEFTTNCSFNGSQSFVSVGWPGFVGVYSGLAPGRFTVSMNAALSNEPTVPGTSIALLIREALEKCSDFAAAVDLLSTATITSDCLLLLTGPGDDEMLVIERTPTNHSHRHPENGRLILTNDFRTLHQTTPQTNSPLFGSTCSRYNAVAKQLSIGHPSSADECLAILNSDGVRMSITVQQMVLSARSGKLDVRTQHVN